MTENKPSSGKISLHGNGMGIPGPEDIERRAREIAMIDERNPDDFTDADWSRARQELMGVENNDAPEENDKTIKMEREWEITPDDRGRRVPRPGIEEDEE